MILTGQKLEEMGKALYGDVWVSVLSKKLKCSKRTVMRWRSHTRAMPPDMRDCLLALLDDQINLLAFHRNVLDDRRG